MTSFKAYEVEEAADGSYSGKLVSKELADLPAGDVVIEVSYSSVNYKDALSASGNKGVTRQFPHTPGIDAVGTIVSSDVESLAVGSDALVTGYDLGMGTAGGFGQRIRVPAAWVAKLPANLAAKESMCLGTAGLTAALCVDKLLSNGVVPAGGKVLVTGATGGVGMIACALLSKLGFEVVASTGKPEAGARLQALGVSEIISRQELAEENPRPLLKESYAAAVDVVGGNTLANVLKGIKPGGSVAACGLVESPALNTTVLPFILRGVNLLGVDSVEIPLAKKQAMWDLLASNWQLPEIESLTSEIGFDELGDALDKVLAGGAIGRYVLKLD